MMRHADELDRILSNEPEITPSPHFVGEVMRAIQSEAEAPAPLAFPWKRALPGIAAAVAALVLVVVWTLATVRDSAQPSPVPVPLAATLAAVLHVAQSIQVGWIALALVLSFAAIKFSGALASFPVAKN